MVLNIISANLGQLILWTPDLCTQLLIWLHHFAVWQAPQNWVLTMKFSFPPLHNLSHSIVYHLFKKFNSIFLVAQAKSVDSPLIFSLLYSASNLLANLTVSIYKIYPYIHSLPTVSLLLWRKPVSSLLWSMEESLNLALCFPPGLLCLFSKQNNNSLNYEVNYGNSLPIFSSVYLFT